MNINCALYPIKDFIANRDSKIELQQSWIYCASGSIL